MEKKEYKLLPFSKAGTANERLEELVNNRSITRFYIIFEHQEYFYYDPKDGEARIFPDGFELASSSNEGVIYLDRRRMFVHYNLRKESEAQEEQGKD